MELYLRGLHRDKFTWHKTLSSVYSARSSSTTSVQTLQLYLRVVTTDFVTLVNSTGADPSGRAV